MLRRPAAFAIVVSSFLGGCDTSQQNPMHAVMIQPNVANHVTGNALAHIDAAGHFVFEAPRAPDDLPIISPERARELAAAFLRTWGESHAGVWEHQRGAPISTGTLQAASRIYFAASPHGRFPDGYHPAYQRMFGPQYLVFFTSGDTPVLGVAISAYSTDLEIRDGLVHQPLEGGSYFMSRAVAPPVYVPITPEEAVEFVAGATGARVTEVPELWLRAGWHPLLALWRVRLDRSVSVVPRAQDARGGPPARVREVFVGPGKSVFVPGARQAAAIRVWALPRGTTQGGVAVDLTRRGEMPVGFDEVTLSRPED